MSCFVYVGTSIDGYIAGPDGDLSWLEYVKPPEGDDLGFAEFMDRVDAVVMGRNTFETLIGFDVGWHYPKPGLILSSTLKSVPADFRDHVEITSGAPAQVVQQARSKGLHNLYIDGGLTVQRFLREDLIDELIITEIPVLLGGGTELFGSLDGLLGFDHVETTVLVDQLVKRRYRRRRTPTM